MTSQDIDVQTSKYQYKRHVKTNATPIKNNCIYHNFTKPNFMITIIHLVIELSG